MGGGSRGFGIFGPPKKANMRLGAGALRRKAQKKKAEEGGGKQENEDLPDEEELQKLKKMEDEWKKQAFKDPSELSDWDYLYGAMDLFTNNRKRNQIFLIQNIIYSIKREFNKEFEKIGQARIQAIDNIADKNKRIAEIYEELERDKDIFEAKENLLEHPENVLQVKPEEIPFQKFLSKEEKDRLEQERLREEERRRAMMADDYGQRGVKQMMGGTLEEKKENLMGEQMEREEWMDKPVDDMSEEERLKLREFEINLQKFNEAKEKLKKNLENELKKLNNEISEICEKFDF